MRVGWKEKVVHFFFFREETPKEVRITIKPSAIIFFLYILGGGLIFMIFEQLQGISIGYKLVFVYLPAGVFVFICQELTKELYNARKRGSIKGEGSLYSSSHPKKYIIKKDEKNRYK